MANEIGIPISVTAKMPDHFLDKVILDTEDSNAIMAAITDVAKDIRLLARRKMGSRQTGAYPARRSGRMMRNVRVKKSKPQRRGSFWARVQIDSFKDAFWYPAPLLYGSSVRNIQAFRSPIIDAGNELGERSAREVQDAIDKVVQGWFGR